MKIKMIARKKDIDMPYSTTLHGMVNLINGFIEEYGKDAVLVLETADYSGGVEPFISYTTSETEQERARRLTKEKKRRATMLINKEKKLIRLQKEISRLEGKK